MRGPHDQLIEYNDAVNSFETMRLTVYKCFSDFDFVETVMRVFHGENEAKQLMTKVSAMRIISQLTRIKKENLVALGLTHLQAPSEIMIQNQNLIHSLNNTITQSRDHILKAICLLVQHQLLKMLMRSSQRAADIGVLQLDPNRIFQLFDQNAIHGERIVAVISSGLMAEILSLDSQNANFI